MFYITITIPIIIMLATYICGVITRLFIEKIPNKYIPIQNLIIGVLSGIVCFFLKLDDNLVHVMVICIMSSMSASGMAELVNVKNPSD